MALVSVIVPVYRVENYLCRCVDSILNQNFSDFELILVDDGSPDRCGVICDEYAKKDNRIHVIHQKNGGLSSARNTGIDYVFTNSNSEWITFIDSDDWVSSYYLERLLSTAINYHSDISVCDFLDVTDDSVIEAPASFSVRLIDPETLWIQNRTAATTAWDKLYAKKLFQDYRYPLGKLHEDEYTTYKIVFSCKQIAFIDAAMYYYYQNPDSIIRKEWSINRMDSIDALFQQCTYFHNNKFYDAEKISVVSLFFSILGALQKLTEFFPQNKKLIRDTKAKMRYVKRKYKNIIDIKSLNCEKTYNNIMHPYLTCFRKKIKHVLVLFSRIFHTTIRL